MYLPKRVREVWSGWVSNLLSQLLTADQGRVH
jgi:hypothetical protein